MGWVGDSVNSKTLVYRDEIGGRDFFRSLRRSLCVGWPTGGNGIPTPGPPPRRGTCEVDIYVAIEFLPAVVYVDEGTEKLEMVGLHAPGSMTVPPICMDVSGFKLGSVGMGDGGVDLILSRKDGRDASGLGSHIECSLPNAVPGLPTVCGLAGVLSDHRYSVDILSVCQSDLFVPFGLLSTGADSTSGCS